MQLFDVPELVHCGNEGNEFLGLQYYDMGVAMTDKMNYKNSLYF